MGWPGDGWNSWFLPLRQVSKKVGKFFDKRNRETETSEQTGQAVYNQIIKPSSYLPKGGYLGTNSLHIPDHAGLGPSTVIFLEDEIHQKITPIPLCTHFCTSVLKNSPGKLRNILIRASLETSPRIPACRRQINALKTKGCECPPSLEWHALHSGRYLKNKETNLWERPWDLQLGEQPETNPLNLSPRPLFSDFPMEGRPWLISVL